MMKIFAHHSVEHILEINIVVVLAAVLAIAATAVLVLKRRNK